MTDRSRRGFLGLAALAPFAVAATARAAEGQCYDPASLSVSQKSRRRSLGYMEVSDDAKRQCQACAFYTQSQPGCGKCVLLEGLVNGVAVCDSFAPRG